MSNRKTDHPIHPLIRDRWSARAMTGEAISDDVLLSLFEAARFAPSSYNAQPWRFIYAKRDTSHWNKLYDLLVDFNKSWTHTGAVLAVILARKRFEKNEKPSPSHALDAGAAWQNLGLEAWSRGLVAHGMQGFDYERARKELNVPEEYEILAMFVVGKLAPKETLSPELQEREVPNSRKKVEEFVFEGMFK